jgi:hypothetical protein
MIFFGTKGFLISYILSFIYRQFELDQKHKEIQGLESLCAVWEGGVANKRSN